MRKPTSPSFGAAWCINADDDRVLIWCDNASDGMAKVGPTRGFPVSVCGIQYDPLHYYSIIRAKQMPTKLITRTAPFAHATRRWIGLCQYLIIRHISVRP
jgi:hypothetical protein